MSSLSFAGGYFSNVGPYQRLKVESTMNFDWMAEKQMDAYRARQSMVVHTNPTQALQAIINPILVTEPYRHVSTLTQAEITDMFGKDASEYAYTTNYDDPRTRQRLKNGLSSSCHEIVHEWSSEMRGGRLISSDDPFMAGPDILLQDIAATQQTYGDGLNTGMTVSQFSLFDLTECMKNGVSSKVVNRARTKDLYKERFKIFNSGVIGSTPTTTERYLSSLYTREGDQLFRPAFSEYVLGHKSFLLQEDAEAEQRIAAGMGLSRQRRQLNELSIRVYHNAAKWKRLFGYAMYPDDFIDSYVRNLVTGNP